MSGARRGRHGGIRPLSAMVGAAGRRTRPAELRGSGVVMRWMRSIASGCDGASRIRAISSAGSPPPRMTAPMPDPADVPMITSASSGYQAVTRPRAARTVAW